MAVYDTHREISDPFFRKVAAAFGSMGGKQNIWVTSTVVNWL